MSDWHDHVCSRCWHIYSCNAWDCRIRDGEYICRSCAGEVPDEPGKRHPPSSTC